MADAQVSGICGGNTLRVQPPSPVPTKRQNLCPDLNKCQKLYSALVF